ncbi:MAG: PHP domain-containing protein [Armatimonadetes bacterium]|nr:PHP domain-containing protein [Armatimonadota bacterium]
MYPFEIHSHTSEHSACSGMTARELIARCAELGIAGLVVTDHHYQWPLAELQEIAREVASDGLVVLSAYEVTTVDPRTGRHAGDLLIFGAPEDEPPMQIWTPYKEACARARELGAMSISAHPFREGMGAGDRVYEMDVDGIEIFNQNHSRINVAQARQAVLCRGFLGVAGSDAHSVVQVGQFYTVFDRPVQTMDEFITELRARRYAIQSNRPDIR